jgi:ribosome maturation factor RimP
MAFDAEQIRVVGQRVAASHGLDVLEIEFSGPAKHRLLRVFIEKNAEERRKLLEATESMSLGEGSDPHLKSEMWGTQSGTRVGTAGVDQLAGVTHEDCEAFSRDFGTVVDVEDLIPGGEYTLEVSSPGLDRKLHGIEDYQRFSGMLVKVQTFEPVAGNRHWLGRLTEVSEESVKLTPQGTGKRTPSAGKKKAGKQEAAGSAADLEIALKNIEKAQLVPEF